MNCPTCGAENEVDARFCAECGTPLESGDSAPLEDNDRTIMSTFSEVSEEAKTVSVTQEDVTNLAAEMSRAEDAEFEMETPSPSLTGAPSLAGASPPLTGDVMMGNAGGKSNTQRYLVIGVLILLVLCCCCCVLASIVASVSGEIDINDLNFSYQLFSTVEPFA